MRNTIPVAIPEKKWRFLVFDNGGETQDRYTVFYRRGGWSAWRDYFALDQCPAHPLGFSQCGELCEPWHVNVSDMVRDYGHLGRHVSFRDLPDNVQDHVYARLA